MAQRAVATHTFVAVQPDDLPFKKGDVLTIVSKVPGLRWESASFSSPQIAHGPIVIMAFFRFCDCDESPSGI